MFQLDGVFLPARVFKDSVLIKINEFCIFAFDIPIADRFPDQHADHAFRDRLDVYLCITRIRLEIGLGHQISIADDKNRMDAGFIAC